MTPFDPETTLSRAAHVLHSSCVPQGILASANEGDNYRRVWARDGIIAGLAGLLHADDLLIKHFAKTVDTLGAHQHASGIIPSNVDLSFPAKVSYGSTAGRVDATSWWVVGALLLLQRHPEALVQADDTRARVMQAMQVLEIWEMNHGDLLYTPIGGNWADEYVIQGHTLYDNMLRLWGLRLAAAFFADDNGVRMKKAYRDKAKRVQEKVEINYLYTSHPGATLYHAEAYRRIARDPGYLFASVGPMGYDTRWDMAGNALALLLGFTQKLDPTCGFLEKLAVELPNGLLPAFWPVITPSDPDWAFLANNYNYRFKNTPHHFHNGGSWPVFSGLMSLALAANGKAEAAYDIYHNMAKALEREVPEGSFYEYFDTEEGAPHGMKQLCYSASGWLFADMAVRKPLHSLHELIP